MHIAQYCTIKMSSSFRLVYWQGWVFAMAKSIFASQWKKPVKTGKNCQKLEHTKLYRNVINEIF